MAIFKGGGSLQGNSAELVDIAINLIFVESTSLKVFHKFVITIYSIYIHLSEVIGPDNHLEVYCRDKFHQLLFDLKLRIIHFEHEFLVILFNKEHLSLSGIVAKCFHLDVSLSTNEERFNRGSCICIATGYGSHRRGINSPLGIHLSFQSDCLQCIVRA